MPSPESLAEAGGGIKLGGGGWVPVTGPRIRHATTRDKRNKTGCVGISIKHKKSGSLRRAYYSARCGKGAAEFCIDTLGRAEAFRRALAARAEHEMKVRRANAVILAARNAAKNAQSATSTLKSNEVSFAIDSRGFAEGA